MSAWEEYEKREMEIAQQVRATMAHRRRQLWLIVAVWVLVTSAATIAVALVR